MIINTKKSMKSTLHENAQPASTVGDSFAIVSAPGSRQPTQAKPFSAASCNAISKKIGNVQFFIGSLLSHSRRFTQEIADVHEKLLRQLRITAIQKIAHPSLAIDEDKAC